MVSISLSDDEKKEYKELVKKTDGVQYGADLLPELVRVANKVDMRKYADKPGIENRLDVIEAFVDGDGRVGSTEYDPDDYDGVLDSDDVLRHLEKGQEQRINPAHVTSSSRPRELADKRSMIAAMARYKGDQLYTDNIVELCDRYLGKADESKSVIDLHLYRPKTMTQYDALTTADTAAIDLLSYVSDFKPIDDYVDTDFTDRLGAMDGEGSEEMYAEIRFRVSELRASPVDPALFRDVLDAVRDVEAQAYPILKGYFLSNVDDENRLSQFTDFETDAEDVEEIYEEKYAEYY